MEHLKWKVVGLVMLGAALFMYMLALSVPTYYNQQYVPLDCTHNINDRCPNKTLPSDVFDPTGTRRADVGHITWSPDLDVLDEKVVMADAPLTDTREMADVTKSTRDIIGPKRIYRVGDTIQLFVQLYDGYGKPRTVGGDRLLVRIFERSLGASASGYILDHSNGTYTAIVTCLWQGTPTIDIALDFPRQVVRVFYNQLNTHLGQCCIDLTSCSTSTQNYRTIYVFYKNHERQPCQPTRSLLDSSTPICDMSDRNGGMSWYCQASKTKGIKCRDVLIFDNNTYSNPVYTMSDKRLMKTERTYFSPVDIIVRGQSTDSKRPTRIPPCISYNRTQLWFLPSPVGYFIHNQWKILHCRAPMPDKLVNCLKNKHFVLFGDSTMLQWAANLRTRFNLQKTTKGLIIGGTPAKSDSSSFNAELNVTVDLVRHSLPGNQARNVSHSIAKHILKYIDNTNMVFVVHIYAHIITHHHSVWRDRMKHIRQSIEVFLHDNSDTKFLIKGGNGIHPLRLFHYAHYLYRRILLDEFKGLYDRVIYLDVADATTASGATDVHPGPNHVTGMVDQMLAYICE